MSGAVAPSWLALLPANVEGPKENLFGRIKQLLTG